MRCARWQKARTPSSKAAHEPQLPLLVQLCTPYLHAPPASLSRRFPAMRPPPTAPPSCPANRPRLRRTGSWLRWRWSRPPTAGGSTTCWGRRRGSPWRWRPWRCCGVPAREPGMRRQRAGGAAATVKEAAMFRAQPAALQRKWTAIGNTCGKMVVCAVTGPAPAAGRTK